MNRIVLCTNEVRAELQEALDDLEKRVRRPEELALKLLRERLAAVPVPRDEWERELLEAARPWGVSLPDAALSSNGLYDLWRSSSIPASWCGWRTRTTCSIRSPLGSEPLAVGLFFQGSRKLRVESDNHRCFLHSAYSSVRGRNAIARSWP